MDSFFATANNLDQLLDDFEEDECETEIAQDSTQENKKSSENELQYGSPSSNEMKTAPPQSYDLPSIAHTSNNNILFSKPDVNVAVDMKKNISHSKANFSPQNSSEQSSPTLSLPEESNNSSFNIVPVSKNHMNSARVSSPSGENIISQTNEADNTTVPLPSGNIGIIKQTLEQNDVPGVAETDPSCADFVVIEKSDAPDKLDATLNSNLTTNEAIAESKVNCDNITNENGELSSLFKQSNTSEKQEAVSNSDDIMEVFGAIPASSTVINEGTDLGIGPSDIFSPSNPFRDYYLTPMSENATNDNAPSGIFLFDPVENVDNNLPTNTSIQSNTNPFLSNFYSSANNYSPDASRLEDTENTMQKEDKKINSSNNESLPSSGIQVLPGGTVNLSLGDETSFPNEVKAVGDIEPNATSVHTNVQQFVVANSGQHSIGNSQTNEEYSQKPLINASVDVKDTTYMSDPQFEHDTAQIKKSDDDQAHGVLQSVPSSKPNVEREIAPLIEKQEKTSVGFMRDVASTDEAFQRFLDAELENDELQKPSDPLPNNVNMFNSDSKASSIVINNSHDERYVDVASIINLPESQQPQTIDNENVDDDIVNISCIPRDALISESEFEQFLALQANDQITSNVDSNTLPTASDINQVVISNSTTPVSIPVDNNTENNVIIISSDHEGSPTFPLRSSMTQMPQIVNNATDAVQDQQHLRLDVEGSTQGEENVVSRYPETPPPPYTQEMHASYERSFSPTPENLQVAGQQRDEQGQHHLQQYDEVSGPSNGNDFSGLPSSILESITRPGDTEPTWVRDQDAPQCSNCGKMFTFTRRRHHCRACGRVFCAVCCSEKGNLKFNDYKEARVCSMCSLAIKQADALQDTMNQRTQQQAIIHQQPDVVTPVAEEASEAISDATRASEEDSIVRSNVTQPVVIPNPPAQASAAEAIAQEEVGAIAKIPGSKSVRFSDGTRPKHPDEMPSTPPLPSKINSIDQAMTTWYLRNRSGVRKRHRDTNGITGLELPPIIIAHGEYGEYAVKESPDVAMVSQLLESEDQRPQSFFLNPNLIVHIKFLSHADRRCWCFWSEGMIGVGQKEVVLLLERQGPDDKIIPQDSFSLFICIFERARKGKIFNTTDFMPRTMLSIEENDQLFGTRDTAGFLFVQASSQQLDELSCLKRRSANIADKVLPDDQNGGEDDSLLIKSMLFAILVQTTEAPWATLFPMRLMLRLGMETKQYPCPLFSVRGRQPVYSDLGHTILAILCDFRNFKYKVVSVPGLRVVASSNGTVSVQIPSNRFTDTIRIMNSSNESVLAIGTGTFGPRFRPREEMVSPSDCPCDSHLVCVQDHENSTYHSEILGMEGVESINTGAAFVIFNGSLKSDGNHHAKCAIVEDGIMVQLLPEKMEILRASLKSMEDFKLRIGPNPQTEAAEGTPVDGPFLEVKWVEDDTAFNIGMFSPIDGTPFEGVVGFNVQGKSEQKGSKYILRWNQVFFLASTSDPLDMSRLAEQVANGCFLALTSVLHELVKHRQQKIAIRVTVHPENVGYVAGSELRDLPTACMNALDDNLIQTIHNAAAHVPAEQEAVIIELLFSILLSKPSYRIP